MSTEPENLRVTILTAVIAIVLMLTVTISMVFVSLSTSTSLTIMKAACEKTENRSMENQAFLGKVREKQIQIDRRLTVVEQRIQYEHPGFVPVAENRGTDAPAEEVSEAAPE
jgi:hypothetical protein